MSVNGSAEQDAFARTADALSATYRTHPNLLDDAPAQFCNYLLDACGSDHRPLVNLLLASGALLRPRLLAVDARAPWDARRAPLVHQLVATRYLQPDVARWLVDTWGAVLDVAPQQVAQPAVAHADPNAIGAHGSFARAVGLPPVAIARPIPARVGAPKPLAPPSWASGQTARRVGAKGAFNSASNVAPHPATARAIVPRWRTLSPVMTAAKLAQMRRLERAAFGAMGIAVVVVFVLAFVALRGRRAESVLAASVLPVVEPGSVADSVLVAATGPMRPLSVADAATTDSAPVARGQAASIPVALSTIPLDGAHVISRGVGGRYRVALRSVSVTGSASCSTVAEALSRAPSTVEVVTHVPGSFAFALASRSVNGRLDADAFFEAGPQRGTTDGVTWNFRMRGQFTGNGFTAETNTSTDAILRWGRTQSCTTVATLAGERLPE